MHYYPWLAPSYSAAAANSIQRSYRCKYSSDLLYATQCMCPALQINFFIIIIVFHCVQSFCSPMFSVQTYKAQNHHRLHHTKIVHIINFYSGRIIYFFNKNDFRNNLNIFWAHRWSQAASSYNNNTRATTPDGRRQRNKMFLEHTFVL